MEDSEVFGQQESFASSHGDVSVNVSLETNSRRYVPLKRSDEEVEAAGLQKLGNSGRKSSIERMLEESLNTSDTSGYDTQPTYSFTNGDHTSNVTNGNHVSDDSDDDTAFTRSRGSSASKPKALKSDQFVEDAGLSRTGRVARKSSMEKLLEDELQTAEPAVTHHVDEEGDKYLVRSEQTNLKPELGRTASTSSTSSSTDDDPSKPKRRSSIYEQKQIEAPMLPKGNRITARTEHLFKQYERDMSVHETKPIAVNDGESLSARRASYSDSSNVERRKVDIVREEKERELKEMTVQYQQRLADEEQEESERRKEKLANEELKYVRTLGDAKNRYLSTAKGNKKGIGSDEDAEENVDKHGNKIERSGGRIEVVKSRDGVGNIRERFGSIGKAGWKKRNQEDTDQVDSNKVNSARDLFKNIEASNKGSQQRSFNRPTSRKVKNPMELMEMRKKVTYGGDSDELPQDGVIKKSVILDDYELGKATREESLNVYKDLETKREDTSPIQKPKSRLLSDSEAYANMEIKKIESGSNSEAGDAVSGYDTGNACSPTSTTSDGYSSLSDTKENGHSEELNGIKSDITIEEDISTSTLESSMDMKGVTLESSIDVQLSLNSGDEHVHVDSEEEPYSDEDVYENVQLV